MDARNACPRSYVQLRRCRNIPDRGLRRGRKDKGSRWWYQMVAGPRSQRVRSPVTMKTRFGISHQSSVDAQWIVARKDYQQALKRRKRVEKAEKERKEHSNEDNEDVYSPEMDELRCILYFHGGRFPSYS